ncbi:uncharacterized protein BJX67DRAFT_126881 [Aspergillus lucknowensis]|uniref:Uncharacterized protein n=1 Tax=Aspergillus lucknowensis TaxID=176173 RepID=A0ABR4LTP4_9EURO
MPLGKLTSGGDGGILFASCNAAMMKLPIGRRGECLHPVTWSDVSSLFWVCCMLRTRATATATCGSATSISSACRPRSQSMITKENPRLQLLISADLSGPLSSKSFDFASMLVDLTDVAGAGRDIGNQAGNEILFRGSSCLPAVTPKPLGIG